MNTKFNFEGMFEKYGFVADFGYTESIAEIDEVKAVLEKAENSDDEEMNDWAYSDWYDDYFEQLKDFTEVNHLTTVRFGDNPDTMDIFYTNDIEKVVEYILNHSNLFDAEEIREALRIEE